MNIPNSFLTDLRGSDFLIACKLYSLINSYTKINSKGYEICIKQSTIAMSCCLSLSTVKRSLKHLEDKGIIINKYRTTNAIGYQGAYHYTLGVFSLSDNYFYMHNSIFTHNLTAKEFYVYAWFQKLKCNSIARFYQSYNDLERLLKMNSTDIMKVISCLIKNKLVRKQRKRTKCGDFTDNTYFVILRKRGFIKKCKKKKAYTNRLSTINCRATLPYKKQSNNIKSNVSVSQLSGKVNRICKKNQKFFSSYGYG